ncbi:MAG: MFS transporter [Alphaproteobacteria bacterium]|nr:MFS transporter [Alphaproteobacteria bacterium]
MAADEKTPPFERRAVASWCVYDWANSPFPAVILTFVIPAYFAQAVVGDPARATEMWAVMTGVSALAIALLSPVLGAIADQGRARKPWLAFFSAVMAAGSALLWFAGPTPDDAMLVLLLVGVTVVAFELSMVFYNALLPNLVPAHWLGRISGWAWGLGYIGGVGGLLLVLFVFVQNDTPPFGLDRSAGALEHVRVSGPVVAVWLLLFCLPLFVWTPDPRGKGLAMGAAVRTGFRELVTTLRNIRSYPQIWRYLLARMLFTDGINTLFAFGGVFAAGTFGMAVEEVIVFGLILNVTAGLGAFLFGWIDDWIGAKRTILIGLAGIVVGGVPLLMVESKLAFIVLGSALGIFFGPVQAASRSLMARIIPPGTETEMFGLYALSGKVTAFMGPWLVALVTAATGSQRWGMATVLPFLVVGGILLLVWVRDVPPGRED